MVESLYKLVKDIEGGLSNRVPPLSCHIPEIFVNIIRSYKNSFNDINPSKLSLLLERGVLEKHNGGYKLTEQGLNLIIEMVEYFKKTGYLSGLENTDTSLYSLYKCIIYCFSSDRI